MNTMDSLVAGGLFAAFLFGGMLLLLEMGRRWGVRRRASDPDGASEGVGAVDGAVFAMLGLLIAFTFSGAASRFDARRDLIVQEANNIGTAWLRLDLLPKDSQSALRDSFRRYVDSRLEVYRTIADKTAASDALARSNAVQNEIWKSAVTAVAKEGAAPSAPMLLLPALNEMIDITTTRTVALQTHPPPIIFIMLAVIALVSSFLAGYGMAGGKKRSLIHMMGFAAITAGAVYVILDLEFPRLGLIRIDSADNVLMDVRKSMD